MSQGRDIQRTIFINTSPVRISICHSFITQVHLLLIFDKYHYYI